MPHLCPMNWSAALILFWLTLTILYSMVWWLQLPKFPPIKFPSQPLPASSWQWK